MGFFSGVRRRIKKLIPKEVRPFIPYAAAAIPGLAALGPIGGAFTKASLARLATDDEADIKDPNSNTKSEHIRRDVKITVESIPLGATTNIF